MHESSGAFIGVYDEMAYVYVIGRFSLPGACFLAVENVGYIVQCQNRSLLVWPYIGPVMPSFGVFFDVSLSKALVKA